MISLFACAGVLAVDGALFGLAHVAAQRYGLALRYGTAASLLIIGTALAPQIALVSHAGADPVLVVALGAAGVSAVSDADTGYIFDLVTLPALAAILSIAFAKHGLTPALAGTLAAGGAMSVLYAVTRGRGLGLGDVKLACCIGAALDARDGLLALAIAFVLGGAYAAYLLITRRAARGHEMRFGPYLAAGTAALTLVRMVW